MRLTAFALAITYGGGLWMHALHELEGAHELAAPPLVLHWLRDSTLALPLILAATWLGLTSWRRLSDRFGRLQAVPAQAFALALATSLAFAAGTPAHGILFSVQHGHPGLAAEGAAAHVDAAHEEPGHGHAEAAVTGSHGDDAALAHSDVRGEATASASSWVTGALDAVAHAGRDGLRAFPAILLIALLAGLLLGEPSLARRRRATTAGSAEPQPLPLGLWAGTTLGVVGAGIVLDRLDPALAGLTVAAALHAIARRDRVYAWMGWTIVRLEAANAGRAPLWTHRPKAGTVVLRRLAAAGLGAALLVPSQPAIARVAQPVEPAPMAVEAAAAPTCRPIKADVVALDQTIVYNRLGVIDPEGMIFALRRDVVAKATGKSEADGGELSPGAVQLRSDRRPRPLTLRMNVGDCLEISFQNLLSPTPIGGQPKTRSAGISVLGMQLKDSILDDGSNVGQNGTTTGTPSAGLVAPGNTATYTFYAEREAAYELYSPSDTVSTEGIGALAHGLFGVINVEPTGAEWYRSQVTRDDMDLATPAEAFADLNGNNAWDAAVPAEAFTDLNGNNAWDAAEAFTDTNGNAAWDAAVPAEDLVDTNGNGAWDAHRTTTDGHPILDYDAIYPAEHRFAGQAILKMLDANDKIVSSDLTAIVTGPNRGSFTGDIDGDWYPPNPVYPNRNEPFREFTIVFHDEAAVVQAFPQFEDPTFEFTLHGVRDGKGINYGTGGVAAEVLANRLGVGPTADCPECKLEEFFLTSWALGDPAQIVDEPANTTDGTGALITGPKATKVFYPDDPSNVYHSYINDHTKFRNIHVGKEHHIFHLHSHQWLQTPDDDNSSYLDSQAIGPGSSYTYEIAFGGSGNRNKTPGDAIFHCHFYPHFAQGMWALWRNNDVFQRGTKLDANGLPISGALPDGEIAKGTPTPAVVPIPGLAMAPMPGVDSMIVNGQVDVATKDAPTATSGPDGIADHEQGWPAPSGNPGYPFYIPGVAGHRPPTPPLDMIDPANPTGAVMDGGLPRHIITGGTATTTTTPLDLSKVVETATAVYPPEQGTPAEKQAMAFHEQPRHDTFKPDGSPASGKPGGQPANESPGYETNGLPRVPGAPYAEPCRSDNGTFNSAAPLRTYKGADIQLDMKLNKLGWHFPQARMLALWQDVGPLLAGQAAPQPFVMRANSGDCINYYHTNLVPGNYEQDAYQVRTPTDIIGQHIHLVKFDVTSSDGSGNGFNYEDGTFSPEEVRERIHAIRAQNACTAGEVTVGDRVCPVAAAHPFFGPGPDGAWLGARTTIQRWWADPILNNAGLDRTLGNVYTHDHYGPSTHQQTGLYATLIIEPSKSLWRDSETGKCFGDTSLAGRISVPSIAKGGCSPVTGRTDGGPTSWRADVLTAEDADVTTDNFDKESFREFYFEFSDFQHAYAAGKGATIANRAVTIGGKSYTVKVATEIKPDPLHAINPPGAIENRAVSTTRPWLTVKPTLEGQANVCPSHPTMLFTDKGCPETISTADIGTFSINYRNEPLAARVLDPATMSQAAGDAGDLSLALSSGVVRKDARLNTQPTFYPPLTLDVRPGDPYTPTMRVYEADKVRIKVQVGATEEGHNAGLWGTKWLQEFASPDSGWRNSQMMGISEQFNWDTFTAVDPAQKGQGADYLFSPDNSVEGMWNGMWALLRTNATFRVKKNAPNGTDLLPLPNNRLDKKINGVNTVSNLTDFDQKTGYQCPVSAPKTTFNVSAVLARDALPNGTLVYNSRTPNGGPLHDPTAILYVRSGDLDASGKLKAGVPIEPLVLRAKAGDCMIVNLRNRLPAATAGPLPDLPGYNMLPPIIDRHTVNSTAPLTARDTFNANDVRPSNRVGLRPQLVTFDPTRGAGNSVGGNSNNTVAPGATKVYYWYAGDVTYNIKTGVMTHRPIEFGATNLISSDPVKHSNKGAIGSLIIEPLGATWVEDGSSRASATVTHAGRTFRDFVLQFQDDLNVRFGLNGTLADGGPVPLVAGQDDAEDSGMKALNYRSEPLWQRVGIDPGAAEGVAATFDFTNSLANSQVGGDPQTPIFTATRNEAIRLRVLQANGHARNHTFALHGHVWQRNPYTNNSTKIGSNLLSQWVGAQEGHGPTDHFDIVPEHGAGGAFGVTGDYLYRDMAPFNFYNGSWGILRVVDPGR